MSVWNSILSINRRNIEYVFAQNPRKFREIADNKILCKKFLLEHQIPQAPLLGSIESHVFIDSELKKLVGRGHFVLKPNHGFGGSGILIIEKWNHDHWLGINGKKYTYKDLANHAANIIYGVFSLDNSMDSVLIEEMIEVHAFFHNLAFKGIPDIRIITFKGEVAMAMLRLPTRNSDGKANLHSGGLGVGIDIRTGLTHSAMNKKGYLAQHPDTAQNLLNIQIPFWETILNKSKEAASLLPLGYLGFDWVIDAQMGPLVLEINARPGLEIQNINREGLRPILEQIKDIKVNAA